MENNCSCKETFYILNITKGNTKRLEITLDENMQGYYAEMAVRKDFNTPPVILKQIPINGNTILVDLTSDDTNKLEANNGTPSKYIWGVDVVNDEGVRISILPKAGQAIPLCNVYPSVVLEE